MRVLLDNDVTLDVLLERQPFVEAAVRIWRANQQGRIDAYVSAVTPVNVFYIVRKLKGAAVARRLVHDLLAAVWICPVDQHVLQTAYVFPMADFEDAVQQASATASQLDAIITRNTDDYIQATLPVFTPADFIAYLAQPTNDDHDAAT